MGQSLSKPKNILEEEEDLRDLSVDQKSSCNLTKYWHEEKKKFKHNFLKNGMSSTVITVSDFQTSFQMSTLLDEGSFGSVALSIHNETGVNYATKIIAKKKIVKKDLVSFCLLKQVLSFQPQIILI